MLQSKNTAYRNIARQTLRLRTERLKQVLQCINSGGEMPHHIEIMYARTNYLLFDPKTLDAELETFTTALFQQGPHGVLQLPETNRFRLCITEQDLIKKARKKGCTIC